MKEADFSNRREYWKQMLRDQRASGQSVATFCQERGISSCSFYQWSRRLRRRPKGAARSTLVPVEVVKAPPPVGTEPMRIVFQNGVALHFVQTPELEWIVELMRLIS